MQVCANFKAALKAIRPSSTIFVHAGAATPIEMLRVLASEYSDLTDIEMIHLHTEGECFYAAPECKGFRITSLFTGKNLRNKRI